MFALICTPGSPSLGQSGAPCGIVNAIDYPIDISDTLARDFDDFGRFRNRFGGLHTGIDIGFRRPGEAVKAAARGRVTYADPEGWDTEKGVVIIEHIFPDGSLMYSLYGHMEETETIRFPAVGTCVDRGQVVGVIGRPTLSLPHLHYEIRDFLPNDGGPGYVSTNPRLQGWYHPFDFTELWRARLNGGVIASVTLYEAPDLTPVVVDTGIVASVSGGVLSASVPPGNVVWRVNLGDEVIALRALPGDRVVTQAEDGDVRVLQSGRYAAAWMVEGARLPLAALGERLIFALEDGGLAAYDITGAELWRTPANPAMRPLALAANGSSAALTYAGGSRYGLRIVDENGNIVFEDGFVREPLLAPGPFGSWYLLDGANVERIDAGQREALASTGLSRGPNAALTVDLFGQAYAYLNDRDDTLLALDADGEVRWSIAYPSEGPAEPPLMDTGNGCLLYILDANGTLNVFSAATGELLRQVSFYAGGEQTARPGSRLLQVDALEQVLVGAGFHSIALLNGNQLAPECTA